MRISGSRRMLFSLETDPLALLSVMGEGTPTGLGPLERSPVGTSMLRWVLGVGIELLLCVLKG